MMMRGDKGFTLLEVALSIGILSFGLTAVVSVYMLSLSWAEEIRIDLTALQSGRAALYDAGILLTDADASAGYDNNDDVASGYVNDYYIVRTYDDATKVNVPDVTDKLGLYVEVHVKVYYGGNDQDGELVQELFSHQIIHTEYDP